MIQFNSAKFNLNLYDKVPLGSRFESNYLSASAPSLNMALPLQLSDSTKHRDTSIQFNLIQFNSAQFNPNLYDEVPLGSRFESNYLSASAPSLNMALALQLSDSTKHRDTSTQFNLIQFNSAQFNPNLYDKVPLGSRFESNYLSAIAPSINMVLPLQLSDRTKHRDTSILFNLIQFNSAQFNPNLYDKVPLGSRFESNYLSASAPSINMVLPLQLSDSTKHRDTSIQFNLIQFNSAQFNPNLYDKVPLGSRFESNYLSASAPSINMVLPLQLSDRTKHRDTSILFNLIQFNSAQFNPNLYDKVPLGSRFESNYLSASAPSINMALPLQLSDSTKHLDTSIQFNLIQFNSAQFIPNLYDKLPLGSRFESNYLSASAPSINMALPLQLSDSTKHHDTSIQFNLIQFNSAQFNPNLYDKVPLGSKFKSNYLSASAPSINMALPLQLSDSTKHCDTSIKLNLIQFNSAQFNPNLYDKVPLGSRFKSNYFSAGAPSINMALPLHFSDSSKHHDTSIQFNLIQFNSTQFNSSLYDKVPLGSKCESNYLSASAPSLNMALPLQLSDSTKHCDTSIQFNSIRFNSTQFNSSLYDKVPLGSKCESNYLSASASSLNMALPLQLSDSTKHCDTSIQFNSIRFNSTQFNSNLYDKVPLGSKCESNYLSASAPSLNMALPLQLSDSTKHCDTSIQFNSIRFNSTQFNSNLYDKVPLGSKCESNYLSASAPSLNMALPLQLSDSTKHCDTSIQFNSIRFNSTQFNSNLYDKVPLGSKCESNYLSASAPSLQLSDRTKHCDTSIQFNSIRFNSTQFNSNLYDKVPLGSKCESNYLSASAPSINMALPLQLSDSTKHHPYQLSLQKFVSACSLVDEHVTRLLCIVRSQGKTTFSDFYDSVPKGKHAEEVFLKDFNELKLENANELIMFINHSPCAKCAGKLLEFILPLFDRRITVSIRCMYLYRTERLKNIHDKVKSIYNRQGLYDLSHANVELKMISNEYWLELFDFLQVDQLHDYSNYDGSTIRPFVEHISNKFTRLAQLNCPSGAVTTKILPVLDDWQRAMMGQTNYMAKATKDIEILINKFFDKKQKSKYRYDLNDIRREFNNLKTSQSVTSGNVESTRRVMLRLMCLNIGYKYKDMFKHDLHENHVRYLDEYMHGKIYKRINNDYTLSIIKFITTWIPKIEVMLSKYIMFFGGASLLQSGKFPNT